jgi:predicted permease
VANLATASFGEQPSLAMAGALITGVVAVTGIALFLQSRFGMPGPAFSSIFQGSIRLNTYVGIAAAAAMAGSPGITLAAVAILALIPLVNFLCVPVVSHYGSARITSLKAVVATLAKNPLILASLAGFALNVLNVQLPEPVYEVLRLLGRAALPVGLLTVGAGLNFRHLAPQRSRILLASLLKLVLLPAATFLACRLYHVPAPADVIAVLFAALPTAVSSFILARQLGGDEDLMASIITAQTVLAFVTLPLALYLVD